MSSNFASSEEIFNQYKDVVESGVHSNSRDRVYFKRAKGARVWDIDGNQYLDFACDNGANILGHADPDVDNAVRDMLDAGLTCTLESELSLVVARQLQEMVPSAEQVRFANTGTEAVMKSIMIARAKTGKDKIVKMEGGYNGWYDDLLVSNKPDPEKAGPASLPIPIRSAEGLRDGVERTTIPVPFNDAENTEKIIGENRDEIAAVIIDPVLYSCGCILPDPEYLTFLREITRNNNIVLIFDEMITGFRLAPGGAQERYGIVPDLSVFGKALSNGFPLSAVTGKQELMSLTNPGGQVYYGGTFNGHQIALAAANATLEKLKTGIVQNKLDELCSELEKRFIDVSENLGVKAAFQHIGGKFQIYFDLKSVKGYRTAIKANKKKFKLFSETVMSNGILMKGRHLTHQGVCFAHEKEDIDQMAKAMKKGLKAVVGGS